MIDPCGRLHCAVVVPGEPLGQPRQTQRDAYAPRPCVIAYRGYRDRVVAAFLAAGVEIPDPATVAHIRVMGYWVPPKSWSKRERLDAIGQKKRTRPDGENVLKAVADALWAEDQALGDEEVGRRYAWHSCTTVTIFLEPDDEPDP